MTRRRLAALSAAVGICIGLFGQPAPAGAAVPTDHTILVGNFAAGPRDEAFLYAQGTAPEALFIFTQLFDEQPALHVRGQFAVDGTYRPFVGNFDGDAFDEIFFYGPGAVEDFIWNFTSYTSVQSVPSNVGGNFTPIPGDYNSDGTDDIVWYTPGSGADAMWRSRAGGGYSSIPMTLNGVYRPVSGSFGNDRSDDILFYAPGTVADYLFDFNPDGKTRNVRLSINGTGYLPFSADAFGDGPGSEDIFFYAPGPAADGFWDFFRGQLIKATVNPNVTDEFVTAAGDFLGDGGEDFIFENDAIMQLWENTPATFEGIIYEYVPVRPVPPTPTASAAPEAVEPNAVERFSISGR
jgi:hypothetical protein